MRRFYKTALAENCKVMLDGRELKTPARSLLCLPNMDLAQAIAEEWQAQGEKIDNSKMYLTQIAMTTVDRVAFNRTLIIAELLRYLNTDLLCYRAPSPSDLVNLQTQEWQPILDWFKAEYELDLQTTQGVSPILQGSAADEFFLKEISNLNDFRLTILQVTTLALGSLLLAFAFIKAKLKGSQALKLSILDEEYQAKLWGEDPETLRRQGELLAEINAAQKFLELLVK